MDEWEPPFEIDRRTRPYTKTILSIWDERFMRIRLLSLLGKYFILRLNVWLYFKLELFKIFEILSID